MTRTLADKKRTGANQQRTDAATAWNGSAHAAFRFGIVYLTLFALATQISGSLIPNLWFTYRGLGRLWPLRPITHWIARTLFGIDTPLDDVSGGETLFFWIQTLWLVIVSLVIAVAWSLLDRERRGEPRVLKWFQLGVRLALAASLLEYGMTKVIPTQFPAPPLTALVTPIGDVTLSALLWTTIGSAPAYQIFSGCIEVLAGVLLLVPRTATFGALLALVSLTQVLALNMAFDIGVKLVTMHLIAMALILLLPAAPRLAEAVGLRSSLSVASRGGREARFNSRRARALQLAFGLYLIGTLGYINWSFWQVGGGGRPKSPLYGIWNVERLSVDGQERPAELNDYDRRWHRVIFDTPDAVAFQRTDASFARYGISIDRSSGTLALTKGGSSGWTSRFTFERPSVDRVSLDGDMDGHRIRAELRRVDFAAFPLLNSTFRWIRPHDP
jgi:hypothetical protein